MVSAVQAMSLLRGCTAPVDFHQSIIMHNAISNACVPLSPAINTITIASEVLCEYNYDLIVNDVMLIYSLQ